MIKRFAGGLLLALTAAAALALPQAARGAGSIGNPVAGNLGYGVITEKDTLLGSTESEGPIAVGGNLSFGPNYNVAIHTAGSYTAPGDSNPTALLVAGRIDTAASDPSGVLRVLTQGYVKVGDMSGVKALDTDGNGAAVNTQIVASSAAYNSTPRIELTTRQTPSSVGPATSPIDFPTLFTEYRRRAAAIAACPENVILADASGQPLPEQSNFPPGTSAYITLTSGVTNVLKLSAGDLNNISELTFRNLPSATTPFVVVVTEDPGQIGPMKITLNRWFTPNTAGVSGAQAPYMMWDFPTATAVTITGGDSLEGTLFAPSAVVTDLSASNIEGDIVAKSLIAGPKNTSGQWQNAGEIHYFPFNADLDCLAPPEPTPTPTPTSTTGTATPPTPTPTSTSTTGTVAPPTSPPPAPPSSTVPPTTPPVSSPIPTPTLPLPSSAASGQQLADTGSHAATILAAGLVAFTLITSGTALATLRRRKRHTD